MNIFLIILIIAFVVFIYIAIRVQKAYNFEMVYCNAHFSYSKYSELPIYSAIIPDYNKMVLSFKPLESLVLLPEVYAKVMKEYEEKRNE